MNYKKIYEDLCQKAKKQNRKKRSGVHYELHHIVPVCLGGKGNTKKTPNHPNLVLLTAKEHYIAHRLLALAHPREEKLQKCLDYPSSKCYEKSRLALLEKIPYIKEKKFSARQLEKRRLKKKVGRLRLTIKRRLIKLEKLLANQAPEFRPKR